jgi:hypothetical protein
LPQETFTFTGPAPYEAHSSERGATGRSGLVGGAVRGGVDGGSTFNPASQMGSFLDGLLKPAAEAQALDQYVQGATKQMAAMAIGELYDDKSPITKIFGSYAQDGAAAYASQERVAQFQRKWMEDQPDLIQLSPEQLSTEYSSRLKASLTGIAPADKVIFPAIMQAMPGLVQSTAKAGFALRQQQGVQRGQSSLVAGAEAFNAVAASFAAQPQANPEAQVGFQNALNNWVTTLNTPVEGQTSESRKKMLVGAVMAAAEQKQGFAVTAALRSGALATILTEDEQAKLNDKIKLRAPVAYNEALNESALSTDPSKRALVEALERHELALYNGDYHDTSEVVAAQQNINNMLRNATGFDADHFGTDSVTRASERLIRDKVAALEKERNFAEARALSEYTANLRRKEDETKERVKTLTAQRALASADPLVSGNINNVDSEHKEAVLADAYSRSDWPSLSRAFSKGWGASAQVKEAIKGTIQSAGLSGDSKAFEPVVGKFEGMYATNPALAKEYFGNLYPMMLNYRRLTGNSGMSKQAAMVAAFDDTQYVVSGREASVAQKAALKYVSGRASGLNVSGKQAWANAMANQLAADGKAMLADLSTGSQAGAVYNTLAANNSVETAGALAWRQPDRSEPLHQVMRLPKDKADEVVTGLVASRLAKVGWKGSIGDTDNEFQIHRMRSAAGDGLLVIPVGDDGPDYSKQVLIATSEFKAEADKIKRREVTLGQQNPATRSFGPTGNWTGGYRPVR